MRLPGQVGKAALSGLGHGITSYAAALTFFALLSLFPALIIVVALLTTLGATSASHLVVTLVNELAPAGAGESIRGSVEQIVAQRSDAGALVSLSVLIGLWSASSYVGCFIWAVERVYPVAKPPSSCTRCGASSCSPPSSWCCWR